MLPLSLSQSSNVVFQLTCAPFLLTIFILIYMRGSC